MLFSLFCFFLFFLCWLVFSLSPLICSLHLSIKNKTIFIWLSSLPAYRFNKFNEYIKNYVFICMRRQKKLHGSHEGNKIARSHNNFYIILSPYHRLNGVRTICDTVLTVESSISKFNPYLTRISLKTYCISSIELGNNLRKWFRWCYKLQANGRVGVEAATEKIRKKLFSHHVSHGRQ